MIKLPWQRVEQDLGLKLSGHVAVDILYEAKKNHYKIVLGVKVQRTREEHQHHYGVHFFCRPGLRVGEELGQRAEFHIGMIRPQSNRDQVAPLSHKIGQDTEITMRSSKVGGVEKGLTHKKTVKVVHRMWCSEAQNRKAAGKGVI